MDLSSLSMDEQILKSKGIYTVVSYIVGTEPIIDIRRMVMDVERGVDSVKCMSIPVYEERINSGSRAEGFRFASSDFDYMFVRRGIRAVFSSFLSLVDNTRHTILLAETDKTKPGFALLRSIYQNGFDGQVTRSLVRYGSGYYLSSSLWVGSGHVARSFGFSSVHGPCLSGTFGGREVDYAECISSDILPPTAYKSLLRLYRSGKLPYNILKNIRLKGCHLVAISSKRPVHEGIEWRISFSFAEKAIIHSLNHTQFLCYGLLKIFLKEAVESKAELKGLLCSYFMKTAVFWMLLDSSLHWTPDNFFSCFLKCFQLLMIWVEHEYCPNFFIPQNNMFADKFTRSQHTSLLTHLSSLYHEGYQCLLRCPSIGDLLFLIIQRPCLTDMLYCRIAYLRKSIEEGILIREIWTYFPTFSPRSENAAIMKYFDQHKCSHRYEIACVKTWKYMYHSQMALKTGLQRTSNFLNTNSRYYRQYRTGKAILQTCKFDAASNLLCCAIYLYTLGKYKDVLRTVNNTKRRLQDQFIIYPWSFDKKRYAALGGETRPVHDMIRTVVCFPLQLEKETYIPELFLEHLAVRDQYASTIVIPPLVCAHLLGYLSHHRLGRFDAATSVLQELSALLFYDDGYHVCTIHSAISWDILGICQEMNGDYKGAYHSYGSALQQKLCPIEKAVLIRLLNVLYRLHINAPQ